MGIVKRNLNLESHLDEIECDWVLASDAQYKHVYAEIHRFLDNGHFTSLQGDRAFRQLHGKLPFDGFIISLPRSQYFDIYSGGGPTATFAYHVKQLTEIDRDTFNWIKCVVTNENLSFACSMNHEWQAFCPESYYEKRA